MDRKERKHERETERERDGVREKKSTPREQEDNRWEGVRRESRRGEDASASLQMLCYKQPVKPKTTLALASVLKPGA